MGFFNGVTTACQRVIAGWKASRELKCIVQSQQAGTAPIAFAVLRNEMLRLPAFLSHYRGLGVTHFVIVDNNSSDGTQEYLKSQGDVSLYTTSVHFVGKERWINYLLRKHGLGLWCLIVDADELMEYPESDRLRLPELCRYLEESGSNAVHAILLDLYPEGHLSQSNYVRGDDYFEKTWYFDPVDTLTKAPRHFHRGRGLDYRFTGGMRKRVFGVSPCCSKFPLLRYEKGMFLTDGQHYLEGGNFSELRVVLYHFKYLQDFDLHVSEEMARGQYLWASEEYKAYAEMVNDKGNGLVFRSDESIRLEGSRQLEACGYLVRPQSYDHFVKTIDSHQP